MLRVHDFCRCVASIPIELERMSEDSHALRYQCPHCNSSVTVNEGVIGDEIKCPKCDLPFKAPLPEGRPLDSPAQAAERSNAPGSRPVPVTGISDEEVISATNSEAEVRIVHPTIFRRNVFGTIVCWLLLIGGITFIVFGVMTGFAVFLGWLWTIGGILMVLAGGFFLGKWFLVSRTTYLTLTTERTIYRRGIFTKSTSEVQHDDVRNIKIDQNFMERLLKYGNLAISSSGQDEMEIVIKGIPNPDEVASFIRAQQ